MKRTIAAADIWMALSYAVLFLLWKGMVFNTADQGEHLSLVYKALDPSLYPYDLYVDAAWNQFTIRFYYVHLITFLARWMTVEWATNILLFASITSSALAWIRITRLVSKEEVSGYLAPFLIFFAFYGWTIGGNAIQYNLLICSTLAKSIAPWALYLALKDRWTSAALLLGISGLFQILVALQLALVMGAFLLMRMQWLKWLTFSFVFLLFVSPMLLPILMRQFGTQSGEAMAGFYEVLYRVRNPHHYLPSLFPPSHYVKAIALWVLALFAARWLIGNELSYRLLSWMGWMALGLIFYSIMLEILRAEAIGKLQFFKVTIWMGAFSSVLLSIPAERFLKNRSNLLLTPITGISLSVAWIVGGHFKNGTPPGFDHRTTEQRELSAVHQWIAENTSKDALFATFATNESFICEAKRSQFVAWNPIIHEPWFMKIWFDRFNELYGHPFLKSDYKQTLTRADLYFQTRFKLQAPFTHALFRKPFADADGKVIHETQHFVVLENASIPQNQ